MSDHRAFPTGGRFDLGMSLREYTSIQIAAVMASKKKLDIGRIRDAIEAADLLLEELKNDPEDP